jgi:hypothetical protein
MGFVNLGTLFITSTTYEVTTKSVKRLNSLHIILSIYKWSSTWNEWGNENLHTVIYHVIYEVSSKYVKWFKTLVKI